MLSRRDFLGTFTALGALGLSQSCGQPAPDESPFYRGRYSVGRAILGVTPGTTAMPLPSTIGPSETHYCQTSPPIVVVSPPSAIPAIVYYPGGTQSLSTSDPIQIDAREKERFPVMLYAHAKRLPPCLLPPGSDSSLLDISKDYTLAGYMLDHVASHGCVVIAPDLSGLTNRGFTERSEVLVGLYRHLQSLNASVLKGLDLTRIVLAGHSFGGGACLLARGELVATGGPQPVAIGLLAPAATGSLVPLAGAIAPSGLLILKGTADHQVGNDPTDVYNSAKAPKALITIPGANHFGYTDICSDDNKVCAEQNNEAGTISRLGQQLTGGAYLAALMRRFARGDMTVEPYLNGQRVIEVDIFGVAGIQVQQDGM